MKIMAALFFCLLTSLGSLAQLDERIAYVPKHRMAGVSGSDAVSVEAHVREGILRLLLPADIHRVEITDPKGRMTAVLTGNGDMEVDVSEFRAGTYMIRAHGPKGILLKRFVLMRPGGSIWLTEAATR